MGILHIIQERRGVPLNPEDPFASPKVEQLAFGPTLANASYICLEVACPEKYRRKRRNKGLD
jgi:hypothetical protein